MEVESEQSEVGLLRLALPLHVHQVLELHSEVQLADAEHIARSRCEGHGGLHAAKAVAASEAYGRVEVVSQFTV